MPPLRVGILSAASIANIFCSAVRAVASDSIVLAAVASRSPDKAVAFAQKHGIPTTCTYDELIADESIDALYIPLPTGLATAFAVKAATAGKHVLVDKPFDSADGVLAIARAAKAANVAFLDGTHFVHSMRTSEVRSTAARMGGVTHLNVSFTFPVDNSSPGAIRGNPLLEPGGALGDVGWYCFRAVVAMVGSEAATFEDVSCFAKFGSDGIVESACGSLLLSGGTTVTFDCGFNGPCRQRIEVVTKSGTIVVPDFVLPWKSAAVWERVRPGGPAGSVGLQYVVERNCESGVEGPKIVWPQTEPVEVDESLPHPVAMVNAFLSLATDAGQRDYWVAESLATQRMLDACLADAKRRAEAA